MAPNCEASKLAYVGYSIFCKLYLFPAMYELPHMEVIGTIDHN